MALLLKERDRAIASDNWSAASATLIENVIGSDFDDQIRGDDRANSLTGRKDADTLEGGLGDDTILDGEGADRLIGGGGADRFLYLSAAEGGDTIADFEPGTDKLLLLGAAFGGLSAGTLSTAAYFTGTEATASDQRVGYNADTGEVLFDADGVGGAKALAIATLSSAPALSNTDITIL